MLGKACGFPAGMRRQGGIFVKFHIIVPLATRKMPHRVIFGCTAIFSACAVGGGAGRRIRFDDNFLPEENRP